MRILINSLNEIMSYIITVHSRIHSVVYYTMRSTLWYLRIDPNKPYPFELQNVETEKCLVRQKKEIFTLNHYVSFYGMYDLEIP